MAYLFHMPDRSLKFTFEKKWFERERIVLDDLKKVSTKERKYDPQTYFWTFDAKHRGHILSTFAAHGLWVLEFTGSMQILHKDHVTYPIFTQEARNSIEDVHIKIIDAILNQHKPADTVVFWLCGWVNFGQFWGIVNGAPATNYTPSGQQGIVFVDTDTPQPVQATGELSVAWITDYKRGVARFSLLDAPNNFIGRISDTALHIWGAEQQNKELALLQVPTIDDTTHYTALGFAHLDPAANNKDEVRKRFRKLAPLVHPDINKCSNAGEAFHAIEQAYKLLYNAARGDVEAMVDKRFYDVGVKGLMLQHQLETKLIAPATTWSAELALKLRHGVITCDYIVTQHPQTTTRKWYEVLNVHDVRPITDEHGRIYAPVVETDVEVFYQDNLFA